MKRIDVDGILERGYIEEFIDDNPFSPFPQILNTERPDVAVSSLLEGWEIDVLLQIYQSIKDLVE